MAESVRMSELSWPEFEARAKRDPVVFLPCGAFEQHGPHLPLSVDALIPTALAERVAAATGGLVAPAFTYGYKSMPKSGGGRGFPGTINLDGMTLINLVRDVIRELHRHGIRKVCAVVGHYENQWFVTEGIDLALREIGDPGLRAMRLEYWDFLTGEVSAEAWPDGFPGVALEHAAVIETSCMLHLHPDQVRLDLIPDDPPGDFPPYDMFPSHLDGVPSSGALTSAKASTAAKGRRLTDCFVAGIASAVNEEFGAGR